MKCPECAEDIKEGAIKCRFCGVRFQPPDAMVMAAGLGGAADIGSSTAKRATGRLGAIGIPFVLFSVPVWLYFWTVSEEVRGLYGIGEVYGWTIGGMITFAIIVGPVIWGIATMLKDLARPSGYFYAGFWEGLWKRFFWAYGPQLIALYVAAFIFLGHLPDFAGFDLAAINAAKEATP